MRQAMASNKKSGMTIFNFMANQRKINYTRQIKSAKSTFWRFAITKLGRSYNACLAALVCIHHKLHALDLSCEITFYCFPLL
jgi:hypothetical protein